MPNLDVRPEVAAFALLMEEVLRHNDHKGGWKGCDVSSLVARLHEEQGELDGAICDYGDITMPAAWRRAQRPKVVREAVDVANFCMMVADVLGLLDTTAIAEGKEQTT